MVMVISGSSPLLGAKIKSMRRLIYDMYYAEEISMEICGKLINKSLLKAPLIDTSTNLL